MNRPIKLKERETIIQSLKSGVVPRAGLHHIQVGRSEELKSFIKDVDTIAEGGTAFRFVLVSTDQAKHSSCLWYAVLHLRKDL